MAHPAPDEPDRDLGEGAARNALVRVARGRMLLMLDCSVEITGDLFSPLARALGDPTVGLAGPWGLRTTDLKHFDEVTSGEAEAVQGYCAAARREFETAAKAGLRAGATAHDVHRAVSKGFTDRGYHLGHVTGHSIGMTMIEHPKIGEAIETELRENMVFSMHPHVIADNGHDCLYMQDTWLVTADGGEPLAGLPMRIYEAGETRP